MTRPVRGKTLILALLGGLIATVCALFWIGLSGGSAHAPRSRPGVGFMADEVGAAPPGPSGPGDRADWDGGAIQRTIADRRVRDELRKRILAGWAAGEDPDQDPRVASAAKEGRFLPAPTTDGGGMDPAYIQEVVRGEFFPMAGKCYEELLTRHKDAGGRIEMSFTIVADAKLGGILEDVALAGDGGVADEKMSTCMRESLSTLSFRPPAHGGTVTVVYPMDLSPDDEGDK